MLMASISQAGTTTCTVYDVQDESSGPVQLATSTGITTVVLKCQDIKVEVQEGDKVKVKTSKRTNVIEGC